MTRLKLGESVCIDWEDSCFACGWKDEQDLAELPETRCVSIGWVIHKTRRAVTVAPHASFCGDGSLNHTNGHMVIPLSAVLRVRKLRLPKLAEFRA